MYEPSNSGICGLLVHICKFNNLYTNLAQDSYTQMPMIQYVNVLFDHNLSPNTTNRANPAKLPHEPHREQTEL